MQELAQKITVLDGLAGNFGHKMPEATKNMWLDLLEPYPARLVSQAAQKVLMEYEYKTMPPFAVLQKAIDSLCGASKEALDELALAEWHRLQSDICTCGSYHPPHLHPTTAFVLQVMGGWVSACHWTFDDMPFRRREFLQLWAESHHKVEVLQLGAAKMERGLALSSAPQRLGQIIDAALPQGAAQ